jgi:uncharacterized surface protein with fasciclin (FAS1) repeats
MLAHVLGQHVALGSLASTDLRSGPLTMADGSTLDVVVDGDKITIGGATITDPDLIAANGVVHVIDRVLIPDDVDVTKLEASS